MSPYDLTGRPVYFFGCGNRGPGMYWWTPGHWSTCLEGTEIGAPWDYIDGKYTPKGKHFRKQGHAALVHKDDWTILSFSDFSVDSRPSINANLVAPGTHSFDEMCALAKEHFPDVWARFTYEITLVSEVDES